ncbi:protein maelstrom homolog [Pieris napi]|uniref:protein maelstrom homolog n=1 Tax=Pieris napi TaxID=78633 RepID=UPI001FB8D805|nr:protein maelstrom homolog [Pieris napi]
MPKKPAKTAFYYFALDYKAEQAKKGIHLKNLAEAVEAASPVWTSAQPSVRAKYEAKAKAEKNKNNVPQKKYTSYGIPISEIIRHEQEQKQAEEYEKQDISNLVAINKISGGTPNIDIYLMDVNYYCKIKDDYLIGESTMLRFTLQDGLDEVYHEIINPGGIPMGYAYDVKLGSKEFGLEIPDETKKPSNYMQILANIIEYLKKSNPSVDVLPPIFVMPDKVPIVSNFLSQMCRQAGEVESIFRVYRLDTLLYHLANVHETFKKQIPTEAIALSMLKKDLFLYTPQIGCDHHNSIDMTPECSKSRVTRQAFTIMDHCCYGFAIQLKLGKHLPADVDLEAIMEMKEKRQFDPISTVAKMGALSISCSSQASTPAPATASSSANTSVLSQNKRVMTPLRRPVDIQYALQIAPDLDENFPSLSRSMGRGKSSGSINSQSKFK